jgi:hypothetical protein
MLHTAPFTAIEQAHLVQPFMHGVAEWTIKIAVEYDPRFEHAASPDEPCHTVLPIQYEQPCTFKRYPLS